FIETEKSVASNNVLDEVYYALGQNKKVIPVILIDSKTPFRLQRLQHIDFTKDYNFGLAHLLNELKDLTAAEALQPEELKPVMKVDKPFYKKYARLLLIIASLVIIIAAAIIYTSTNKKAINEENDKIAASNDTINSDRKSVDVEPEAPLKKEALTINGMDEKKVTIESKNKKVKSTDNKIVSSIDNKIVSSTDNKIANLNEAFAGDWKLVDVDPKAESTKGYLKIEAIDEKKATIKSYVQFYYFKTNDTSYLSVFNAFAGCSSCVLEKDMKIKAEDVAINSHTYRTLKKDQPDGGKAGDTIMNAGANKSIRAFVTLHLIDNKTAIIKVQQPAATELSYGLVLKPFIYSFRFTKIDY
ncbi:MAG: hypothetical protein ABIO81_12760, partial [Ginsengibacter sp.]